MSVPMMKHAILSPSSRTRWTLTACPGSAQAEVGYPNKSSAAAERGTLLHEIAAELITNGVRTAENATVTEAAWNIPKDNPLDEDEIQCIQVYLDAAHGDMDADGGDMYIERRVEHSDRHFGTADFIQIAPPLLRVNDLKTGSGVFVPENNLQAQSYAVMASKMLNTLDDIEEVDLVITQPRYAGEAPVRRHRVDRKTFDEWAERLEEDIAAATAPDAPLKAGRWCQWCLHRVNCDAHADLAKQICKEDFDDMETTARDLTDKLAQADILEGWIKAVRSHAFERANDGETIPGYKLVERRATRKWKHDAQAAAVLKNHGVEPIIEKVISPAQAEKALGTGGKQITRDLVTSGSSGLLLVPDTDRRPPAKVDAASDFQPTERK